MSLLRRFLLLCLAHLSANAIRYGEDLVGYNLNENQTAVDPRDYWGQWDNHTYNPSPSNWRFPFYALTLDRYLDGDPTNNEANDTVFEHNWMANQFRFGGDVAGVLSDLDYIQGLGIKAIYFTGSMFLNMPWSPDGYGPLDFTLLDRHHGDIAEWRSLITEIHNRGMYAIFDNTMATMGNLMTFGDGFTNQSVTFNWGEYDYIWKHPERQYHDFHPHNDWNASCQYPRIWEQNGYLLPQDLVAQEHGCRASEFEMYGNIDSTGSYESYINQLSRFGSVQDRLREWQPDVLEKINIMSCMQIAMLDIDGFRMDKGVQTTLDAMAQFSSYQRQCARNLGKDNFLMVGEVVANPGLAATYFGRGKQPDQALNDPAAAVLTSNATDSASFIRPFGESALDGAAFHYDVYGSMTRFLGLDSTWGSLGVDWVEMYNDHMLARHDLVNANTGLFDPRHMFGTTNQDVFRWPALANGTQRQMLGLFVTTLELPGIPMVYFGEEQSYYLLESLAPDYVYGRAPLASSRAWQLHGCYNLGEEVYVDMPFNSSSYGCYDDSVSLDHRDPSHPVRNYLKRMFEMREQYPTLNDGYNLTTLSTRLYDVYLPGSSGIPSPFGMWSVYRGRNQQVQDFTGQGKGNQGVWLVLGNENKTVTYDFDCSTHSSPTNSSEGPLLAAFPGGTTVKNLFYPYEEYTLETSNFFYGLENSTEMSGCLPRIELRPWDFKAFVPKSAWVEPNPVITNVAPRHDARIRSSVDSDQTESVTLQIQFSSEMDCNSVANNLVIESATQGNITATLDMASVNCTTMQGADPWEPGYVATAWMFTAQLHNVANGVHTYTLNNVSAVDGQHFTNARDKFMFRIGQPENPMVFPLTSNYTTDLLHQDEQTGNLYISPRAAGAHKVRFSTNWGSSFSAWMDYTGENITIDKQNWSGTKAQEWSGEHVIVHYWSSMTASSDHVQHADLNWSDQPIRRWPHAWVEGSFNQWGFDGGIENKMKQDAQGNWYFDLYTEWPTNVTINVWGMNPDGQPDQSAAFGDVDRDGVLDWLPPDSINANFINISASPSGKHLGYRLLVNDGNYSYRLIPTGSLAVQAVVMVLICLVPLLTAILCVLLFIRFFYRVKFNKIGIQAKRDLMLIATTIWVKLQGRNPKFDMEKQPQTQPTSSTVTNDTSTIENGGALSAGLMAQDGSRARRTVLIATMEYEIPDWKVKVKIGGLGVMSALMGNNLRHQDLIWVVPCLGDIEYPFKDALKGEPIALTILGQQHEVDVYYHVVENITYVIVDAPIFRKRTKAEPYPSRMDDIESGVYYSAWNQCIASTIERFKPDIYHINDYHGALAPLYLLPEVVPCCLSLHNAEFQGLWTLKSTRQMQEICRIFNLDEKIVKEYVQYGDVFNLLHAGSSYLRIHQQGFGAVGVSSKYSVRSCARYPIFWGLSKIGSLPNPDPTDLAPLNKNLRPTSKDVKVDLVWEEQRSEDRRQAQEWAGLNIDKKADLFIFVGRWSNQKGVDLIADVFYSVLKEQPSVQLMCVGPVIDLHGKFAALKLSKLMDQFPGRVCSKPEFTMLPPYVFSGAEFALMPSRDEPFGLVAVEFGRKGALCVGSRVGGFGHMPGWWYTVESMTSKHLLGQFKSAISSALASDYQTRALMRAYSKRQRFPVAQWVEDLEKLQSRSIEMSEKVKHRPDFFHNLWPLSRRGSQTDLTVSSMFSGRTTPQRSGTSTPVSPMPAAVPGGIRTDSRAASLIDLHHLPGLSEGDRATSRTSRPVSRSCLRVDMLPDMGMMEGALSPPRSRTASRIRSRRPSLLVMTPEDSSTPRASTPNPEEDEDAITPMRRLSLSSINKGVVNDSSLHVLLPFFDDKRSMYYDKFSQKLDKHFNEKTSEGNLCIEEYLVQSEKQWFNNYHTASLRTSAPPVDSSTSLLQSFRTFASFKEPVVKEKASGNEPLSRVTTLAEYNDYFGTDYTAPKGVAKFMQRKIGSWPLYCFLLAFGQIISANSYQLTLLTGQVGETANELYILSAIYLACSFIWWLLYRTVRTVYVLSLPFLFFGLSFFMLSITIVTRNTVAIGWLYNVASGMYTIGSSAATMFFALNFGTEGGTPSKTWAFRAWCIAGTQQLLIAFLWYWGSYLVSTDGSSTVRLVHSSTILTAIAIPLAVLMWVFGLLLFFGLPTYYRQVPGGVPSFYAAICRRPIVLWFWLYVVLQGYWLSTNYNRNWQYLWSSNHAPRWAVALVIIFFFVGVWSGLLSVLAFLSKSHSWIIPIFAIGLGAPRWCQFLWSLSGIGFWVPWSSHPVIGALVSRGVWAWLGVLDSIQGVGFGMILLMTLTRTHIVFALVASQMVGSVVTTIARATAPNKVGPGGVFINLASDSLASVWFWISLICQLVICVGFFKFFRKAQLMKP